MKNKKYYGLFGKNGYGVFDDYDRLGASRVYVIASRIKKFDTFEKAKEWAEESFWDNRPFFETTLIKTIQKQNWVYYIEK